MPKIKNNYRNTIITWS